MNRVKELKEIGEYLTRISMSKGFIKEVLMAVQTEEEIIGMKKLLVESPEIVPAEVYDALIELTNGRFEKEFVQARYLKQEYLRNPGEESLNRLLKQLEEDKIYSLAEWKLTDEELETMEQAEVGDTVHIATEVLPSLFTSEENEAIIIYAYTSDIEIPQEYFTQYAIYQTSMNDIIALVKSIKNTIGKKVVVLLDYDSDDSLAITDVMLLS